MTRPPDHIDPFDIKVELVPPALGYVEGFGTCRVIRKGRELNLGSHIDFWPFYAAITAVFIAIGVLFFGGFTWLVFREREPDAFIITMIAVAGIPALCGLTFGPYLHQRSIRLHGYLLTIRPDKNEITCPRANEVYPSDALKGFVILTGKYDIADATSKQFKNIRVNQLTALFQESDRVRPVPIWWGQIIKDEAFARKISEVTGVPVRYRRVREPLTIAGLKGYLKL